MGTQPRNRSPDDSPEHRLPWRSARALSGQGRDGPRSHRRPAHAAPSLRPGLCLNCCGAPFSGAGAGAWGRGAPHSSPRGQGNPSHGPSGAGEPLTAALGGQGSPSRCPQSPGPGGIRSKQWSVWKDHAVKAVLSGASRVPWIQTRRSTAAQRELPQSSAPGAHASEYSGTEQEDDPREMERFSPTLWSNLVFRRE